MRILIFIATVISIFTVIFFRKKIDKNKIPTNLIASILLIFLTAYYVIYTKDLTQTSRDQLQAQKNQFQKQIELQTQQFQKGLDIQKDQFGKQIDLQTRQFQDEFNLNREQFIINSRPSVFISDWGEFKKYNAFQTIQFKLENVGQLPAKFDEMSYSITIGGNNFKIESDEFKKPTVIFPSQKNMFVDLPIPYLFGDAIIKNKGFILYYTFTYYSINDKEKKYQYSYNVKYDLRMTDDDESIDEYILLESGAK